MKSPLDHIYRVRNGKLLGVCGGLARHFGMGPDTLRIIFIIFTICTGFGIGLGIYFVLALLMPTEPVEMSDYYKGSRRDYRDMGDNFKETARDFKDAAYNFRNSAREKFDSYNDSRRDSRSDSQNRETYNPQDVYDRKAAVNDIITRSERLSRRIEDLEQKVTKDDISWEQRLGSKTS